MTGTEATAAPPADPAGQERQVRVHLAELLAARGMKVAELAEQIGIHPNNVSKIKNGHIEGIRFPTLAAICDALECQPGDLLTYG